ncbi:MAG: hypothetical protein ACI9K2_005701, partial [Myxococcota bacterium]
RFDGVDDRVGRDTVAGLEPGVGPYTVEAWIRAVNPVPEGEVRTLVRMGPAESETAVWLELRGPDGEQPASIAAGFCASAPCGVSAAASLDDGEWHHVAAVWVPDALGTTQLVVDGATVGEASDPFASVVPSGPLTLGRAGDVGPAFDGFMDDVRLWTVARSAEDLDAARWSPVGVGTSGLLAAWSFADLEPQWADDTLARYRLRFGATDGADEQDPQRVITTRIPEASD